MQDTTNNVDYLIISPDSLLTPANVLASHRAEKGRSPGIAIWESIQSIWSDSSPDSNLKYFLKYAWENWEGENISFLVLVGDWEIIPSHGIQCGSYNCYFDNWYGFLDSLSEATNVPLFALGRIPVESKEQLEWYVQRIIKYETQIQITPWQNRVVGIADTSYIGPCLFDIWLESYTEEYFEPSNLQTVIASMCGGSDYYIGDQNQLISLFTRGSILLLFVGNSANDQWAVDSLVTLENIDEFHFWEYSPIILSTAMYQFAFRDSLTSIAKDLFTHSPNGPIAVYSSSNELTYSDAKLYQEYLIPVLLDDNVYTIGESLKLTISQFIYLNHKRYFQLYGDPAITPQFIRDENDIRENLKIRFSFNEQSSFVTIFPDSQWHLIKLPFTHYSEIFSDSVGSQLVFRFDIIPDVVRYPYWGGQFFFDDISLGMSFYEDFENGFENWGISSGEMSQIQLSLSNDTPEGSSNSLLLEFSLVAEDTMGLSLYKIFSLPLEISLFDTLMFWVKVGESFLTIEKPDVLPENFFLYSPYPNPFNPITTIQYDLPEVSDVRLVIYDLLGREVITLIQGRQEAGYQSVRWNGRDRYGREVATGVYLYQLKAGDFIRTKKLVLIK